MLSSTRKSSICTALQTYKTTVLNHNISMLKILIDAIDAQPDPEGYSPEKSAELRMQFFADRVFGCDNIGFLPSTPSALLSPEFRDRLVRQHAFDGVRHLPLDLPLPLPAARPRRGRFTHLREKFQLLEVETEEARRPSDVPEDLEFLCSLVDGIIGTGFAVDRLPRQCAMISPSEDYAEVVGKLRRRDDEDCVLLLAWEGLEIGVAIQLGAAEWPGGSFALWCRDEDEEQENTPFAWKYGLYDLKGDFESELFETVEEYLEMYAHFKEQTPEEVRKMVRCIRPAQDYYV